jgi:LacI family transcriptional regulator, galactose operon repressor
MEMTRLSLDGDEIRPEPALSKATQPTPPSKDETRSRPTLKEVAALAGVSWKTVSRVMNREPGVSTEMAARVQAAARQLGYKPDMAASSLRRSDRRTATVGLLLQDLSNPFSASVLRGVEDVARDRGVAVVAASLDEDPKREQALVEEFIARRVDGLIVAPVAADQGSVLAERQAELPVVFVDREPDGLDADVVVVDNAQGAYDATVHLIKRGHRRIAFLGDRPSIATARQRLDGYLAALRESRIPIDERLYRLEAASSRFGYELTLALLGGSPPPTALFAAQNFITMGALRALAERGVQHKLALVGFDDFPLADLLDPPVSVVAQEVGEIGRQAAMLMFSRLDGDRSASRRVVLPTRFIPRGSGEISPG